MARYTDIAASQLVMPTPARTVEDPAAKAVGSAVALFAGYRASQVKRSAEEQAFKDVSDNKRQNLNAIESWTAWGQMYNSSVDRAWLAQNESDGEGKLAEFYSLYSSNPQQFESMSSAWIDGTVKSSPSAKATLALRASYAKKQRSLLGSITQGNAKAARAALLEQEKLYLSGISRGMEQSIRGGDFAAAIEEASKGAALIANSDGYATPEQQELALQQWRDNAAGGMLMMFSENAAYEGGGFDYSSGLDWVNRFQRGNLPKAEAQAVRMLLDGTSISRTDLAAKMSESLKIINDREQAIYEAQQPNEEKVNVEIGAIVGQARNAGTGLDQVLGLVNDRYGHNALYQQKAINLYNGSVESNPTLLRNLQTGIALGKVGLLDLEAAGDSLSTPDFIALTKQINTYNNAQVKEAQRIINERIGYSEQVGATDEAMSAQVAQASATLINMANRIKQEGGQLNAVDLAEAVLVDAGVITAEKRYQAVRAIEAVNNDMITSRLSSDDRRNETIVLARRAVQRNSSAINPDKLLADLKAIRASGDFAELNQSQQYYIDSLIAEAEEQVRLINE